MKKKYIFLFLGLLMATIGRAQGPVVIHEVWADAGFYSNHAFTWVNHATLRTEPNRNAKAVGTLPIGSVCDLMAQGKDTIEIAGIQSPWYKVKSSEMVGWIWGGLLTRFCAGSNVDPEVKFLMGYQLHDDILEKGFKQTHIQIRAIKNQKELSNLSFPLLEPTWGMQNIGSKGLKGVNDIIAVSQSGESCGHFYGSAYVLWDGIKLMEPLVIGGVPDGDFGVWDNPIFPSDMEGRSGFLIIDSEDYVEYVSSDVEEFGYIAERIAKRSFTQWEEGVWTPLPELSESKTLYYLISGNIGPLYFPEELKVLPNELSDEVRTWINSHKQSQK